MHVYPNHRILVFLPKKLLALISKGRGGELIDLQTTQLSPWKTDSPKQGSVFPGVPPIAPVFGCFPWAEARHMERVVMLQSGGTCMVVTGARIWCH